MSRRDDDPPAGEREQAEAARFARLVDDLVAGAPPPPALDLDARALLDTAALLRPLGDARRDSLVDAAFAGRRPPAARRLWLGSALLVAAAALLLLVVAPGRTAPRGPASQASRPADALVGPIDRADRDAARARADLIFADRLAGYRQLALGGRR